ncbi:hypothetical protein C8R45DRAFT_1088039 [Mycena sanguinolenta]|nr:hypothetical protein C8R45DRAFT_1088039 [Mycena sanguinolenta]
MSERQESLYRMCSISFCPSFLLSKRAQALGRDVHIFSLSDFPYVCVMAGMSSQRLQVSVKTLYRWLDTVDEDERDEEFILKEISLVKVDVLSYCVGTIGSSLSRDSSDTIKPGLYGPFYTDGRPFTGKIGNPSPNRSFVDAAALLDRNTEKGSRPSEKNLMPVALVDAAIRRDNGVCCVTGRADVPTSIIWVFPPMLAIFSNDGIDYDRYQTLENTVTMSSALVEPFHQNTFTVDVDNDYCIVQFDSVVGCNLPPRLAMVTASHEFWRESFKWALSTYIPGTDVRDDFPDTEPARLMQQLYNGKANLAEDVWGSDIGEEVLDQYLLEAEMEEASSDEDSLLTSPISTTNLSSYVSLSDQSTLASSEDSELASPVSISHVSMPQSLVMPTKPIVLAFLDKLDNGNQDVD